MQERSHFKTWLPGSGGSDRGGDGRHRRRDRVAIPPAGSSSSTVTSRFVSRAHERRRVHSDGVPSVMDIDEEGAAGSRIMGRVDVSGGDDEDAKRGLWERDQGKWRERIAYALEYKGWLRRHIFFLIVSPIA
jgi:hypothetical protein